MKITPKELYRLIERQGYRCALTGRELTPQTTSLDHIFPVTRGGQHCMENVWFIHEDVNRAKSTMTAQEFIVLCEDVVRHSRRLQRKAAMSSLGGGLSIEIKPLPLFGEDTHSRN